MTNIQFIFNVSDIKNLTYKIVCRYFIRHRSCFVFLSDEETIAQFSDDLWGREKFSFLPHEINKSDIFNKISLGHNSELMDDVIINGTNKNVNKFSRYQKLYELVGINESDKKIARERFLFYKDRGYEIEATDFVNFKH